MKIHMLFSRRFVVLLLAVILAGCHSYDTVQFRKPAPADKETFSYTLTPSVHVGDDVKYTLVNGEEGEMKVQEVTGRTITGEEGLIIPYSEISTLEIKKISPVKTLSMVFLGGYTLFAVVMSVAALEVTGVL
jgi:hypothetical protein